MELKKELWYLRTRMKANAKDIVVQHYNLVISDEALAQWHTENSGVSMSAEKLRTKLLKDLIKNLIGDAETKDSYFIYGRGTVGHVNCIVSSLLTRFMWSVLIPRVHSSTVLLKKLLSKRYLLQVEVWIVWPMHSKMVIPISSIRFPWKLLHWLQPRCFFWGVVLLQLLMLHLLGLLCSYGMEAWSELIVPNSKVKSTNISTNAASNTWQL